MSFQVCYLFLISIAGFFILTVLSILAFINHKALRIKKDKHIHSGIMLIITAVVVFFYSDIFDICDYYLHL